MVIQNSVGLLNSLSEIEEMIKVFEEKAIEVCPELDTKKFLEIAFSQILEKRVQQEN